MKSYEMKTVADAKQVWAGIYQNYESKLQDQKPVKTRIFLTNDSKASKAAKEKKESRLTPDNAARLIQNRWQFLRRSTHPVNVVLGKKHSAHLHYFLNQTNIKKLLNKEKLAALEAALEVGDWNDPIFKDKNLDYLAMSLCCSGKITEGQLFSLLDFLGNTKDYPLKKCYRILDEKGEYTAEAKSFFLPFITRTVNGYLDSVKMNNFKLLVAALPKSEQVFYTTEMAEISDYVDQYDYDPSRLTRSMVNNRLVQRDRGNRQLVHWSFGVTNARNLARFGDDRFAMVFHRLSKQKREDVEFGIRHRIRVAVTYYRGTVSYEVIHYEKNVTYYIAKKHDDYHTEVLCSLPGPMVNALIRFVDVTRESFKLKWSKEIWSWVDGEILYFLNQLKGKPIPQSTTIDVTNAFFEMLNAPDQRGPGLFLFGSTLTPCGAAIMLDMIQNRNEWLKLKIDPKLLKEPFAEYYQWIEKNCQGNESSQIKIAKAVCYFQLQYDNQEKLYPVLCEAIERNPQEFLNNFKIIKTAPDAFPRNRLVAQLNGNKLCGVEIEKFISKNLGDEHYTYARMRLDFDEETARNYADLRKKEVSDREAQFQVQPNFGTWFMRRPILHGLSMLTVVLPCILYACEKPKEKYSQYQPMKMITELSLNARLHESFPASYEALIEEKTEAKRHGCEEVVISVQATEQPPKVQEKPAEGLGLDAGFSVKLRMS